MLMMGKVGAGAGAVVAFIQGNDKCTKDEGERVNGPSCLCLVGEN